MGIPLKLFILSRRQISSQLLPNNQSGPGLGTSFFRPTPPVMRNINSCLSILFSALKLQTFADHKILFKETCYKINTHIMIVVHIMNENNVLSFSNNDRHTLAYKLYVNVCFRASKRISIILDLFLQKIVISIKF